MGKNIMSGRTIHRGAKKDEFLELVMTFAPKPIRTAKQYYATVEVMNKLAVRDENSLSAGERDYLEMLTLLVEKHDENVLADMHLESITPARILRSLMEEGDLKASDLAPLVGGKARISQLLSGARLPSKAQAMALGKRFRVDAGLFLA
jgi:HTH-type transcriptional regulator/antitoxin HigA